MLETKRSSFGVIARIRSLPEKAAELRQRLLELVSLTQDERGCVSCEMIENDCDSTEFTLLEEWRHEAAHNAHFSAHSIQTALAFIPALLSNELDIRRRVLRLNTVRYGINSYALAACRAGAVPGA